MVLCRLCLLSVPEGLEVLVVPPVPRRLFLLGDQVILLLLVPRADPEVLVALLVPADPWLLVDPAVQAVLLVLVALADLSVPEDQHSQVDRVFLEHPAVLGDQDSPADQWRLEDPEVLVTLCLLEDQMVLCCL